MAAMTCPNCRRKDDVEGDVTEPPSDVLLGCTDCGARIAFGRLMPRVVISPADHDSRFVVVAFDGAHFLLDKDLARGIGHNLLSIV